MIILYHYIVFDIGYLTIDKKKENLLSSVYPESRCLPYLFPSHDSFNANWSKAT